MTKTILITGATDGIGFETAKMLAQSGHHLLIHGRSAAKLAKVEQQLSAIKGAGLVEAYIADFSLLTDVKALSEQIIQQHDHIDVVINNAGVFKAEPAMTAAGLDVRFVVNTLAPYLLTKLLLPMLPQFGRVLNLSSAAQAPVDLNALQGNVALSDMAAYSQSKLAIRLWSEAVAEPTQAQGLAIIAVNPGSLLASKMVTEGFGIAGNDLSIGADILVKLALDIDALSYSGQYFDNDTGHFVAANTDNVHIQQSIDLIAAMESIIAKI